MMDDSDNFFDDSLEEQLDEIPNSPEFTLNNQKNKTGHVVGSNRSRTESLFLKSAKENSIVLPTFTVVKKESACGRILDLRDKLKKLNSKEFKSMRLKDFKESKKKFKTGLRQAMQQHIVEGVNSNSSSIAQRLMVSKFKICSMMSQVSELENAKKEKKSNVCSLMAEQPSLNPSTSDTLLESSNSEVENDNASDISRDEIPDSLENSSAEEDNAHDLVACRKTTVDQNVTVIEDESVEEEEMDDDSLNSNSFHSTNDLQVNDTVMAQAKEEQVALKLYRPDNKPSRANTNSTSYSQSTQDSQQLFGFLCKDCQAYYATRDLSKEQIKLLITKCNKHRGNYHTYKAPKNFWEIDFPSQKSDSDKASNSTNSLSDSNRILDATYNKWETGINRNYRPSNVLHSTRY